ncbi:MAG: hypothetical protein ISS67_01945 [Desulfobacterales bacterium]|uniref:HEPN AbiU2-like domain-containing protein n=1 Tax=Candidatus Desulfaltia bathyphila TaxID=2841697 RepID=A0A8J6N5T3_9BACT|nr:hypothetical protein [Candidatus Desulfaltia bathyphila]MBL7207274.1 hypothetical protein [Desulfobacterales bacterium]
MVSQKLIDDFCIFRDHCIIIRRDYNTYNDLFFSGVDKVLNKTAPVFFNDIAEIMHRDWMLQVCKLMDPSETKRKGKILENISIGLINSRLENEGLISDEISSTADALLKYGKKIVPARHKRLAHLDRDHQLSKAVLGATTEEELQNFLENIQKYCDTVGRAIGLGPLDFTSSSYAGDVHDLLRVLREYNKDA